MRVAATIAALGAGRFDGEEAFIPLGSNDGAELTWHAAAGEWRSEERDTFTLHSVDLVPQNIAPNDWEYLYLPTGNAGEFNRSDYGWDPQPINQPGAAYAAGLHLQENLTAAIVAGAAGWQLGTVHYEFDQGDQISGAIDPEPHVSVILQCPQVSVYASTGWTDSSIPTPTKQTLAPHLYSRFLAGGGGFVLKSLLAQWRWVGAP